MASQAQECRAGKAEEGEEWGALNEGSYLKAGGPRVPHFAFRSGTQTIRSAALAKMKVSCPMSCLLLLSIGTCLPPDDDHHLGHVAGEPGLFGFGGVGGFPRQDLSQEIEKSGKDPDGVRSRREKADNNEAANSLPGEDGEKRAGGLEGLAEELHGYSRKKGGFSFRFGRRGRRTELWGGRGTPFYPWG